MEGFFTIVAWLFIASFVYAVLRMLWSNFTETEGEILITQSRPPRPRPTPLPPEEAWVRSQIRDGIDPSRYYSQQYTYLDFGDKPKKKKKKKKKTDKVETKKSSKAPAQKKVKPKLKDEKMVVTNTIDVKDIF